MPLLAVGVAVFHCPHRGQVRWARVCGCLVTVGKDQEGAQLSGLCADPTGGRGDRPGSAWARGRSAARPGTDLQTIILASSVLYELIGPGLRQARRSTCSGSYSDKIEEIVPVAELTDDNRPKTELEKLIERIQRIQKELPVHSPPPISEEEQAFTQAAMEQYEFEGLRPRSRLMSRRKGG